MDLGFKAKKRELKQKFAQLREKQLREITEKLSNEFVEMNLELKREVERLSRESAELTGERSDLQSRNRR